MKLCTKCGKEPRVDQSESATNRHCTKCRTEAARAYQATKMEQKEGKGFGRGVEAMRRLVVEKFMGLGNVQVGTFQAAEWVRTCEGPTLAVERDDATAANGTDG